MYFKEFGDSNIVYKMLNSDPEKGVTWVKIEYWLDSDGGKKIAAEVRTLPLGQLPNTDCDIRIAEKEFDEMVADAAAEFLKIMFANEWKPSGKNLVSDARLKELEAAELELKYNKIFGQPSDKMRV
jgi:hypothetical protein